MIQLFANQLRQELKRWERAYERSFALHCITGFSDSIYRRTTPEQHAIRRRALNALQRQD